MTQPLPPARTILWRRIDQPGHEAARLHRTDEGWLLTGSAVFAHEGEPCQLTYEVVCDREWRTRSAVVTGWVGARPVDVRVAVDGGCWRIDGEPCPAVDGCTDVDLNFSPSTNLLPIRRLGLAEGESAAVRAAWLRFPSFALQPLEQEYRRTGPTAYRYESAGGSFVRELEVDESGFVVEYPGIWREA